MAGSERVAVVTGASSGIGRAIVERLARRGDVVATLGRDPAALEDARIATGIPADRFRAFVVDLTSASDLAAFAAGWRERLGRVDLLVHSAGDYHFGTLRETPVGTVDRLLHVNTLAPYSLTRMLLDELRRRQGQVVFLNSSASGRPQAQTGQYAASKAALKALADSLRQEIGPAGVRVLSVFPGRTATPMQERVFAKEGRPYEPRLLLQPGDVADAVLAALSLPRNAELTELHLRPMTPVDPAPPAPRAAMDQLVGRSEA